MPTPQGGDEHKARLAEHPPEFARFGGEEHPAPFESTATENLFAAGQVGRNVSQVRLDPILRHTNVLDLPQSFAQTIHACSQPHQARASTEIFALVQKTFHEAPPIVECGIRRVLARRLRHDLRDAR